MNILNEEAKGLDINRDSPSLIDQLAKLMENLETRPSWDEYFMATAFLISSRSACERLHVGCVLISSGERKNRIIAAGYNGFLPGTPHISHVQDGHEQATVHAEQNAITDAARRGISVEGAMAYITHFPCVNCTKMLIAAGIKGIKYHFDYRNDPLVKIFLNESGILMERL